MYWGMSVYTGYVCTDDGKPTTVPATNPSIEDTVMKDSYKDTLKLIGLSFGNLGGKLIEDTAEVTKKHRTKLKKAYDAYKDVPKVTRTIDVTCATIAQDNKEN